MLRKKKKTYKHFELLVTREDLEQLKQNPKVEIVQSYIPVIRNEPVEDKESR